MKPKLRAIAIALLILFLLAGCGGSETDQAAQETKVAAAVGATLTAGAPPPLAPVITVVVPPVPPSAESVASAEPAPAPVPTALPDSSPSQPPSGPAPTSTLASVPPSGQEEILIFLKPGGGGDYPTLADAIHHAPPGAHVLLEPGLYPLEEPITVAHPLILEGSGAHQTVIHSLAAELLLKFEGAGPFVAEGISFRHDGSQPANVVVVLGGEVDFAFCTFTGGVFSAEAGYGGSGLFLGGSTAGRVYSCESIKNQEQGILLRESAQPSITRSSVHHNGASTKSACCGTMPRPKPTSALSGCEMPSQAREGPHGSSARA
jgi:hypothetical protein